MEYKTKRIIEIAVGCVLIVIFVWLIAIEPIRNLTFISHFVFLCSIVDMMVFDFKNKYLNIFLVINIPSNLFIIFAFQIADTIYSFSVFGYGFIDHLIRNIVLHGMPLFAGFYIIRTQKDFIFTWSEYKTLLIVYILWCYFFDYRYTDIVYAFIYGWYMVGNVIWKTLFTYYFLRSRNRKLNIPSE